MGGCQAAGRVRKLFFVQPFGSRNADTSDAVPLSAGRGPLGLAALRLLSFSVTGASLVAGGA